MRAKKQSLFDEQQLIEISGLLQSDETEIVVALKQARVIVRALAQAVPDEERFQLARSFGQKVVQSWWDACCLRHDASLALREPQGDIVLCSIDDALASIGETLGKLAARLDTEIAAYQIGLTYTSMLPTGYRSSYGIFYTPPVLTKRLINLVSQTGINWSKCRVLDPACGGGAFLAPIAERIIEELPDCNPRILLENIANRLRGYEIDPFGAWLAQVTLDIVLLPFSAKTGVKIPCVVKLCDSLQAPLPEDRFDLVIGNPPYARTRLSTEQRTKFKRSLFGHANLYGIFTDLALRHAGEKGLVAYVTPTSFLAGEYFKNLRDLLGRNAPPQYLDFVAARRNVFDDVLQETLLATYRLGAKGSQVTVNELHVTSPKELNVKELGGLKLPSDPSRPWILPRNLGQVPTVHVLQHCKHYLVDWGYKVSTGPLVWNRFKDQLHSRKAQNRLPLIWAESILQDGRFEWKAEKRNHEPWFEIRDKDTWLVSKQRCVLLQRTTAKEQHRRLIAAALPEAFIEQHGAVVIENHLNMLKPLDENSCVRPEVLAAFLNSRAADMAFRCVSGSVAVSAYELESLPLPPPYTLDHLHKLVFEEADSKEIEEECQRLYQGYLSDNPTTNLCDARFN